MMQCFDHAKANESRDAVAVCSNCGAAVCTDHLVEEFEMGVETNQRRRLIFCQTCSPSRKR